jgi:hypothetical protein
LFGIINMFAPSAAAARTTGLRAVQRLGFVGVGASAVTAGHTRSAATSAYASAHVKWSHPCQIRLAHTTPVKHRAEVAAAAAAPAQVVVSDTDRGEGPAEILPFSAFLTDNFGRQHT